MTESQSNIDAKATMDAMRAAAVPAPVVVTEEAPAPAPAKRSRAKAQPAAPAQPAAFQIPADPALALPLGCGPTLPALAQLDAALLQAQSQFGVLLKDADNPYFKSSYVSLPSLLALVRPILRDCDVLISSSYQLIPQVGFIVSTTLTHTRSGGFRFSSFPVADATKPQAVGAAGTYGLRLSLLQLLSISGEDDDGNAATSGAPVTNAVPMAQWQVPSNAAPAASAPASAPAVVPNTWL